MRQKRELMFFACHFYTFLHCWWSLNCCRECMDLKRNDSVVHVVFLRSKTKLMAEVSASVHLTDIILFTFPENTESLNCFILCWSLLRNVFTEFNCSAFFTLSYHGDLKDIHYFIICRNSIQYFNNLYWRVYWF